ncbi:hypothetical protein CAPN004_08310 [Capnocytophaga cynodegmi]|uniref:hypothetical protein n=1 Tax=Capnocytophaga cynodegmi TaxID=28189 RepID=UPI001AC57F1C|nr:hypothetical protein [Capnocytophaga cynodegmi]GIM51801.1 hypothetical protein CAPN004_08310 [Capnocytophaga cynodegmi]
MKKVTPKQIERLYEFTRQHYVEYYDVQTELVDHLANAIETHWQEFPDDDFETALQKEFRKFGVFGFMDILEEKTKQMSKRYNRILWQKTKEFFTIPKVLLTLCIGLAFYTLLSLLGSIKILVPIISLTIFAVYIIGFVRNKRLLKQNTNRRWLFEDIIIQSNGYGFIMFLPLQMSVQFAEHLPENQTFISFYSALYAFCVVLIYILVMYLPKNRGKYLSEIYPQYNQFLQA